MNELRDIHKFPKNWGHVVFPISMTRIGNALSPKACFEYLVHLQGKITTNKTGVHFVYSEGLYMNFEQDAYETKNNFAQMAAGHMNGIRKLLAKNIQQFQIETAFSFDSWFQMYLSHKDFFNVHRDVRRFYESDEGFQQQVARDAQEQGKELNERQLNFFLEEHTYAYLLLNEQMTIRNDYVLGREKWILLAYPGDAPKGQIYLFQRDPLAFNKLSNNPYIGQYDLERKVFIPYLEYDLSA